MALIAGVLLALTTILVPLAIVVSESAPPSAPTPTLRTAW
jgi:hypothetical protein